MEILNVFKLNGIISFNLPFQVPTILNIWQFVLSVCKLPSAYDYEKFSGRIPFS